MGNRSKRRWSRATTRGAGADPLAPRLEQPAVFVERVRAANARSRSVRTGGPTGHASVRHYDPRQVEMQIGGPS